MMKLSCMKHEFSIPDGNHYLNCAYMSPLSKRVEFPVNELITVFENGPVIMIDGKISGKMTPAKVLKLIEELA